MISETAKGLIRSMMTKKSLYRLSLEKILEHNWLKPCVNPIIRKFLASKSGYLMALLPNEKLCFLYKNNVILADRLLNHGYLHFTIDGKLKYKRGFNEVFKDS